MARTINRLSPRTVAAINKAGMHADGGGLYLQVSRYDTKSWIFRFALNGRERQMGLGSLNTITLADARAEAGECRKMLREGLDPIEARNARRNRQRLEVATSMTFQQCAESYIEVHRSGWRNAKHGDQWNNTLATYAYPVFGNLPVSAVDVRLVMKALQPIWSTKTETATRVRGRIERILDWAAVQKYREGENPARWRGHLDKLLPKPSKVRKVKHHAALPYKDIGAFMVGLRNREAIAARGLEFLILTATRTSEALESQWGEIDLTGKVWTIPADRMKSDKEHRIPLSPPAVALIEAMKKISQSDYVFPGARSKRPLSNMAFLQLLKRMGHGDLTAHGFRSTFRDWAAERTNTPNEVAEMALAHVVGDKVEAAYRRGDLFDKRRRLMDDWAEFCSKVPVQSDGDKVVPIKGSN
jgi:integrase